MHHHDHSALTRQCAQFMQSHHPFVPSQLDNRPNYSLVLFLWYMEKQKYVVETYDNEGGHNTLIN